MALNFPDNPTTGQLYTDSTAGFTYEWDGVVWKSYTAAAAANIKIIDDLESSFDDVTLTFPLTSSGNPVTPINPQQLRIVLGGIVQEPAVDYNVAGSDIIFTTAPATGLSFSGVLLGGALSPVGLASTGSVYVRQSYSPTGVQTTFTVSGGYRLGYLDVYHNGVKLVVTDDYTATDGSTFDLVTPAQNGDTVEAVTFLYTQLYSTTGILDNLLVTGNATVTGVTTLGGVVKVGVGTTSLIVEGDARVTGILTVGTSSITLDGTNNEIKIGTGLTISSSGITGTASTVTSASVSYGLEGTPNINVGFITATGASISGNVSIGGTLTYEDVTNVDSVGLITARSGIILTGGDATLGTGVTISGSTANVFTLSTNGSERVRVDSSGRLAIGLTGPDRELTVAGYAAVRGTNTGFLLYDSTGATFFGGIEKIGNTVQVGNNQNQPLTFVTNNSERLRIANTGAFGLSGANYGTSGQVLTSQGSGSAPQWATPAGGAWQFISSVTASSSSSVAFTSGIDSTYDVYAIVFNNVVQVGGTNADVYMRLSTNGGSTWISGTSDYNKSRDFDPSSFSQDSGIRIITILKSSTAPATPISGIVYLYNFNISGSVSSVSSLTLNSQNGVNIAFGGSTVASGVHNAVQIYPETTTMSGTFRLYGIKNS